MCNQKTKKMEEFIASLSSEDRLELFLIIIEFTEESELEALLEAAKDYLEFKSSALDIEIREAEYYDETLEF